MIASRAVVARTVSGETLNRVALFVALACIIGMQLPLLSPFRRIDVDEIIIADSVYMLATGQSPVPALQMWSHIIPEFGTINFYYPPLYFYVLAGAYRLLGFSIPSVALLHILFRLLAAGVFYLVARRIGHSILVSAALTVVWATFVPGLIGRPEDLAILFLILGVYVLVQGHTRFGLALAGGCLGLAFLCHPNSLVIGLPLFIAVFILQRGEVIAVREGASLLCGAAIVASFWLLWIVPYWSEFRTLFFGFVVPDAATPSYWRSFLDFNEMFIYGTWDLQQFLMQYSLVPLFLLMLYLVFVLIREKASFAERALFFLPLPLLLLARVENRQSRIFAAAVTIAVLGIVGYLVWISLRSGPFSRRYLLVFAPLVLFLLVISKNEIYHVPFRWFTLGLVVLIPIVGRLKASAGVLRLSDHPVLIVLAAVIAVQVAAHLLHRTLALSGDLVVMRLCGRSLHAAALDQLPRSERVLTKDGYTFYYLRSRNPIYWPAGLTGETTRSRVPFSAHYDDTFRWGVFPKPVDRDYNAGVKFAWDDESHSWFEQNFVLHTVSRLDGCLQDFQGKVPFLFWRLKGFSDARRTLYIYSLKEPNERVRMVVPRASALSGVNR